MANQVFPTKGNLIATKKSLELAKVGYDLMDQKRNVLIKEMTSLLEEVKKIRGEITDSLNTAYKAVEEANVSMGMIEHISSTLPVETGLSITYRSVMGVEIPKVHLQPLVVGEGYDLSIGNSKVDYAYLCFSRFKLLLAAYAELENAMYRLANAISKTQKRANALKNVSIPEFEKTIKFISEALEEKEREEFSRQKVIKAMK